MTRGLKSEVGRRTTDDRFAGTTDDRFVRKMDENTYQAFFLRPSSIGLSMPYALCLTT